MLGPAESLRVPPLERIALLRNAKLLPAQSRAGLLDGQFLAQPMIFGSMADVHWQKTAIHLLAEAVMQVAQAWH